LEENILTRLHDNVEVAFLVDDARNQIIFSLVSNVEG
jgi:hypothetical protein